MSLQQNSILLLALIPCLMLISVKGSGNKCLLTLTKPDLFCQSQGNGWQYPFCKFTGDIQNGNCVGCTYFVFGLPNIFTGGFIFYNGDPCDKYYLTGSKCNTKNGYCL